MIRGNSFPDNSKGKYMKKRNQTVFILWHVHKIKGQEDENKLIGVYSSKQQARSAQNRTKLLPGFKEHRKGFIIDEYEVGKDHWTEGFVTIP
jgi:hypothetical protein